MESFVFNEYDVCDNPNVTIVCDNSKLHYEVYTACHNGLWVVGNACYTRVGDYIAWAQSVSRRKDWMRKFYDTERDAILANVNEMQEIFSRSRDTQKFVGCITDFKKEFVFHQLELNFE